MSVPFLDQERALCIVVPHTTSIIQTRLEIVVEHPALKDGAFDVQQTSAVQAVKFIRKLGDLSTEQLGSVEQHLAQVLGLKLAAAPS
jgi:mRNA interferase MazF